MSIKSFEEAVRAVQSAYDEGLENKDSSQRLESIRLAGELGSIAWMNFGTAEELKPVADILSGRCKRAFLGTLKEIVTANNNRESLIASNLRPYVVEAFHEVRFG
ncbi:MAG: hypothetical protein DI586_01305 [Micavibrio aeruginosavorus]|uniref:Uncharacterized protein n=1 Tax=Micavibrio aeruginosavorus TaxID=349221 RepID=A0A2W5HU58_9BACT|nr:MAG: hypothetical protein DI586_01305 [Micavibrio aeruginosavorus]